MPTAYNRPAGWRPLPGRLIRASYAVFPFLLRPVEGSVSVEHQLLGRVRVRKRGHAEAGGHCESPPARTAEPRGAECSRESLGESHAAVEIRFGDQDRELLSAVSRCE